MRFIPLALMLLFAAAATTPTTQPAGASAKFADGAAVECVAVCDELPASAKIWSADGTELPAPPWAKQRMRASAQPPAKGTRPVRFMLRITSPNEIDPSAAVMIRLERAFGLLGGSAMQAVSKASPNVQLIDYIATIGDDVATTNLSVSLAGGKWEKVERYDIGKPAPADGVLKIGKIIEPQRGRTSVQIDGIKLRGGSEQSQVVALLANGKEISSSGMSNSNGVVSYMFATPQNQIIAIVHRTRPMELVEIRDVSVNAGNAPTTAPAK